MANKEIEYEYCAVNVLGWAWGDTKEDALRGLAVATNGKKKYTKAMKDKYLLRVFKIPKGKRCDRWQFYCPVWDSPAGVECLLLEDNMRDWGSEKFPISFEV